MAPKSVLVTGGNRGIGYGLVKKFLENKEIKHIFATARKPDEASELKKLAVDSRLHLIQMEVSCDKSIQTAFLEVEKVVGDEGLNLLVNNAGILVKYSVKDQPNRAELARQLDVNTISPLIVTQIFLPLLQKAATKNSGSLSTSRAAIINISSTGGSIAMNDPSLIPEEMKAAFSKMPPIMAYRASKSALNCITKQLSHDLKDDGIFVACFCPGWVQTDMGGPNAMIPLEQCTNDLVPTIYNLKAEQTGGYFNNKGESRSRGSEEVLQGTGIVGYRASKCALNSIIKQLPHDLKADGIRVACFCPGYVQTVIGGANAMASVEQCANELVSTLYNLKSEQSGGYFNSTGTAYPY